MKILTVVGTRPQFIKSAPVSRALRERHDELLVHTGQHYDDLMSDVFFRELRMPTPDVNLDVGSGSHAEQTAEMMLRLEPVVADHRPDGVLLYGDTNSTLAGALVAAKLRYDDGTNPWIAHVEAGLRAYNRQWPEEHNRVVADHLADLLLAPTDVAMHNLGREGLAARAVKVGDVMVESFEAAAAHGDEALPDVARHLPGYILLTMHRGDNVDDPRRLGAWLDALRMERPVVFPVHPRTAATLTDADLPLPHNVHVIEPVGYLAMVALEQHAALVVTDSGGVQREAYLAGVPCLTLRDETEWIETLDGGWNRLVSSSPDGLRRALADDVFTLPGAPRPPIFGDGRAAERIVAAIETFVP
ncbi:MAG TPA: UDP-N-acetylglucosamine 2-epimerase (non-hydrolyzing) [Candidatus Limnocylindria bacterium]|nr:UDP-N-acetylglucosamine 2-epimerase (non-hydrolyzing) [Candidatus Limnocylindria bacterium]